MSVFHFVHAKLLLPLVSIGPLVSIAFHFVHAKLLPPLVPIDPLVSIAFHFVHAKLLLPLRRFADLVSLTYILEHMWPVVNWSYTTHWVFILPYTHTLTHKALWVYLFYATH